MKYLWIICLLSVLTSVVVFQQIPEGMELPYHWDADGEADRYTPAWKGLTIPPLLMILMVGLFAGLKWIEPRAENLQKSLRARDGFALAIVLMMLVLQLGTIAMILGFEIPKIRLAIMAVGLGFIIMGNYMGKTRSNYFIGIPTPWSLSNEDNWRRTHRLGGKLHMFAGAVMLMASWVLVVESLKYVVPIVVAPVILIPAIYSWWLWRQEQGQESPE